MSLDGMLAAHDEAALTALSSKGLMRLAMRDLEEGAGEITARSVDAATIVTDGQTVEIDGRDVKSAKCICSEAGQPGCPHQGHRRQLPGPTRGNGCKRYIHRRARADGGRLQGPRIRRRVFVTAAALLVRAQAGIEVSAIATIPDETKLNPAFCTDIANLLARVVPGTLTGSAELAADNLFDSAISARAGAAPRAGRAVAIAFEYGDTCSKAGHRVVGHRFFRGGSTLLWPCSGASTNAA